MVGNVQAKVAGNAVPLQIVMGGITTTNQTTIGVSN
jgi:hypothetical protein